MPRLVEKFRQEVAPALTKEFGYRSIMEVPKLVKVVLNVGLGESLTNAAAMEATTKDVTSITGQHPVITRAKKSIANFKVRKDQAIGMKVTLRGARMYEFFDRLVNAALPRTRDFQGLSRDSFDGRGNYHLGLKEQIIFPEVEYDKIDKVRGMTISIVTTARTDKEAERLLELLGLPLARK